MFLKNKIFKVLFETYVETNQTFLQDAWVITK